MAAHLFAADPELGPSDIRRLGLVLRTASASIAFSECRSTEDYRQVLNLRRRAYALAGKVSPDATDEEMGDEFDHHSLILCGKRNNKTVASARVTWLDDDTQSETERYLSLPAELQPRSEVAEISRLCVDPSLRGTDLFEALLRECLWAVVSRGRRIILASAAGPLIEAYVRYGARRLNASFAFTKLADTPHELLAWNVPALLRGEGVERSIHDQVTNLLRVRSHAA